jgi:ferredoxin
MRKVILLLILFFIITLVMVSGCKKPTTVEYNIDRSACNGCGRCVQVCPYNAIEIDNNGKAVIDQTLCKQDGLCVRACPQNAVY